MIAKMAIRKVGAKTMRAYFISPLSIGLAAVSIFPGTGLCTGRIGLGAAGTGFGGGMVLFVIFISMWLDVVVMGDW